MSVHLEVVPVQPGRRRWTDAAKMSIVEESLQEGMSVSFVARRHHLHPPQVFAWRRMAREGKLGRVPLNGTTAMSVSGDAATHRQFTGANWIELMVGDVAVRLPHETSALRLAEIASALRPDNRYRDF